MLVEHVEAQVIGPPVAIGARARLAAAVGNRALGLGGTVVGHRRLLLVF